MHQHGEGIENSLKETRSHLDKLVDDITRTLEKVASREKYINNQLEHHLQVTDTQSQVGKLIKTAYKLQTNCQRYLQVKRAEKSTITTNWSTIYR